MRDSSSIRGNVFWPAAIIGGGLFILAFFLIFDQPAELAIGASLSFVVLAFASLLAGVGRTRDEVPETRGADGLPYADSMVVRDEELTDTQDDDRPARTSDGPEPSNQPAPDITADEDPLN